MGLYFFRADANSNIGMGHVMRCLSIADAVVARGHEVVFLLADNSVADVVTTRGFKCCILYSDYTNMESELDNWPVERSADVVFVDSYYVTREYLIGIKKKLSKSKLAYLDDVATFAYPVDCLVNYNAYGPDLDYQKFYCDGGAQLPKLILGPKFAPLRAMFQGIPSRTIDKDVKKVLISTGGADEFHIALGLISHIGATLPDVYGFKFHFLLGAMNEDKQKIYELSQGISAVFLHEKVDNMRGLIESCDMVVSAAGSTMYEICACGVPMITYSLADNQKAGASAFGKLGLAVSLGDLRIPDSVDSSLVFSGELKEDALETILDAVERLAADYDLRCSMGKRMQKLIDGRGAERIVEAVEAI